MLLHLYLLKVINILRLFISSQHDGKGKGNNSGRTAMRRKQTRERSDGAS